MSKFIVVEGTECAGKSFFIKAAKAWAEESGKQMLDISEFVDEHNRLPLPEELDGFDVLISREMTTVWTGDAIRQEMVRESDRVYSGREIAEAFSIDRLVLYRRVIRPALERDMIVFSDRSVASSIAYQPVTEPDPIPLEELLALSGQKYAFETKIDHIIVMMADPDEVLKRTEERTEKVDDAIFEKESFLKKIDKRYKSDWFKELFEKHVTEMYYIDTTHTTIEQTKQQVNKALLNALS